MRTLGTVRPNPYPFRVLNKRFIEDITQAIEGASRTDLIKRPSNKGEGWTNSLINVRPFSVQGYEDTDHLYLDSHLYQRTENEQDESVESTVDVGEVSGVARALFTDPDDGVEKGLACEFIFRGEDHFVPVPSNLVGETLVVEVVITERPSSIGANTVSGALVYEGTLPVLGFPILSMSESTLNGDRALSFDDSHLQLPSGGAVDLSGRKALIWRTGAPTSVSSIIEVDVSTLDDGGVGIGLPIVHLEEDLSSISVCVLGVFTSSSSFPAQTANDTEGTLNSFSSHVARGTFGSNGMSSVSAYLDQWVLPSLSEWTGRDSSGLYLGAFIAQSLHRNNSNGKVFSAHRPSVTQGGFEEDSSPLIRAESNDGIEVFRVSGRGLQEGIPVSPFLSSEVFQREVSLAHGSWSALAHMNAHLGLTSQTVPTSLNDLSNGAFLSPFDLNGHIPFPFCHITDIIGQGEPFNSLGMNFLRHGGFFGFKSFYQNASLQSGPLLSWDFDSSLWSSFNYDNIANPKTGGVYADPSEFFSDLGPEGRVSLRVPFNPPHGFSLQRVRFVGSMNFKDGQTPRFSEGTFLSAGARLDIHLERYDRTPITSGLPQSFELLASASYADEDFVSVNEGGAIHVHESKALKFDFEDRIRGGGVWDGNQAKVSPRYYLTISVRPPAFVGTSFVLSGLQLDGFSLNLANTDILV